MISIEIDDRAVLSALDELIRRAEDPTPALKEIGETLAETTKRRFDTSTGPDGQRWESNSQATILQYLGVYKGSYNKDGRVSSKGAARVMAKKPLIGETRSLMSTIAWQLSGKASVEIGSPMEYAAVQQFGAKRGQFGATKRGSPIPWGNIPARPFLGIDDQDRNGILETIADYLAASG